MKTPLTGLLEDHCAWPCIVSMQTICTMWHHHACKESQSCLYSIEELACTNHWQGSQFVFRLRCSHFLGVHLDTIATWTLNGPLAVTFRQGVSCISKKKKKKRLTLSIYTYSQHQGQENDCHSLHQRDCLLQNYSSDYRCEFHLLWISLTPELPY